MIVFGMAILNYMGKNQYNSFFIKQSKLYQESVGLYFWSLKQNFL